MWGLSGEIRELATASGMACTPEWRELVPGHEAKQYDEGFAAQRLLARL